MSWSIYKINKSISRRMFGYNYQRVFGEFVNVPTAKTKPENVTYMVGTFLNRDSNGFQVSTTKVEPGKVTCMVGSFLNRGSSAERIYGY